MESGVYQKDSQLEEAPKRLQIYPSQTGIISDFWRERYEREAKKYWDIFYKRNADKFFKDRHYLGKEWGHYFQQLGEEKMAKDFNTPLEPLEQLTVVLEVFTLSAVSPDKMPQVLQNLKSVLKPNAHVLVRDYAIGDLAQERLSNKDRKISNNFYVRGDGTRVFYFTEAALTDLFAKAGFACESVKVHDKKVENRLRDIVMDRRWIQGAFHLSNISSLSGKSLCNQIFSPDGSSGIADNIVSLAQLSTESTIEIPASSIKTANIHNQDIYSVVTVVSSTSEPSGQQNSVSSLCEIGAEVDLSEGIAADLFGCPVFEVIPIHLGNYRFHIKCLSKENQHTFKATGLMLWESAYALATLLARNPTAVAGKMVLELGCGSAGICSMVAAMGADLVIATDGDAYAVSNLVENINANAELIPQGKLFPHTLMWGKIEDLEKVKESTGGRGFEIILGTDVTYIAETIPLLFLTARALITDVQDGNPEPLLLLSHVTRQVDEDYIVIAAGHCGFFIRDKWPYDENEGEDSGQQRTIHTLFAQGLNEISALCSSVRILCFSTTGL